MDEINKLKTRYAHAIEDGRKIEAFTSMPEYQWYVEHVVNPTISDYTNRILTGKILTDKEDWIMRGMIMGIKLVTETPEQFKRTAKQAKEKAKLLQEEIEENV